MPHNGVKPVAVCVCLLRDVSCSEVSQVPDGDFVFEDPRRIAELNDKEKELVVSLYSRTRCASCLTTTNQLFNSRLGQGIDISDPAGPTKTGLPVVKGFNVSNVYWEDTESGSEEVLVSYSERTTTYASQGWAKAAISAETPYVSGSIEASMEMSSSNTTTSSTLYVTGRYLYSKCQVTLPNGLQPHPDFKNAVMKALDVTDAAQRTNQLAQVFKEYGHVYYSSVEMGGMKHTTSKKTRETSVREIFCRG